MPTLKELERWYTITEAAEEIYATRRTLYRWLEDGRLRAVETRAGWLIDPVEVERVASERRSLIARRMKEIRESEGKSLEHVAKWAGYTVEAVERMEAGEKVEVNPGMIAFALGVRPQALVRGHDWF